MPAQAGIQAGYGKCGGMDCRWRGNDSKKSQSEPVPFHLWEWIAACTAMTGESAAMTHANERYCVLIQPINPSIKHEFSRFPIQISRYIRGSQNPAKKILPRLPFFFPLP
jgi:hypothetical protein